MGEMEKLISSPESTFGKPQNDTENYDPESRNTFDLSLYLGSSETETVSTDAEVIPTLPLNTYQESDVEEALEDIEREEIEVNPSEYEVPPETEEEPSRPPPNIYVHTELNVDEETNPTVNYKTSQESHINKSESIHNQQTE